MEKWKAVSARAGKKLNVKISFDHYRTRCHFHDRFYLAVHSSAVMSGLFGPSLSGLSANDFVLIGELERPVLDRMKAYLEI